MHTIRKVHTNFQRITLCQNIATALNKTVQFHRRFIARFKSPGNQASFKKQLLKLLKN